MPVIAIGTTTGRVLLLSVVRPQHPAVVLDMYLNTTCIMNVKFTNNRNSFVVNDLMGYFYLIEVFMKNQTIKFTHSPLKDIKIIREI